MKQKTRQNKAALQFKFSKKATKFRQIFVAFLESPTFTNVEVDNF